MKELSEIRILGHSVDEMKRDLLELLQKISRKFIVPIKTNDLCVIQSPSNFYKALIDGIDRAKNRIIISSLYIGERETELIQKLSIKAQNNLNVKILLDYFRSHRSKESELILKPLKDYIYFYKNQAFIQCLNPINYFNEMIGVMHMKWIVFDNTVIITGANLSKDYFNNRHDRYYEIKSEILANYYEHIFDCMKEDRIPHFSHYDSDLTDFDTFIIPTVQIPRLKYNEELLLLNQILDKIDTEKILRTVMATPYLNLSEAMHKLFLKHNTHSSWKIITSSHKTNGFFEANGIKSKIPDIYDCFKIDAISDLTEKSLCSSIEHEKGWICEYDSNDRIFHTKGIWLDLGSFLITSIGSSNFNNRSGFRDVENQTWIFTTNNDHIRIIKNDLFSIESKSKPISVKKSVGFFTFLFSRLLKSYF